MGNYHNWLFSEVIMTRRTEVVFEDYVHVVELAKAHEISISRLFRKDNKVQYDEVFNLGTGSGYSVLELIHTFKKVTRRTVNYKIVDRRPGDVEKIYTDTKQASVELGWKAKHNLSDILSSAWKW